MEAGDTPEARDRLGESEDVLKKLNIICWRCTHSC